jgi:hypothetical protein
LRRRHDDYNEAGDSAIKSAAASRFITVNSVNRTTALNSVNPILISDPEESIFIKSL